MGPPIRHVTLRETRNVFGPTVGTLRETRNVFGPRSVGTPRQTRDVFAPTEPSAAGVRRVVTSVRVPTIHLGPAGQGLVILNIWKIESGAVADFFID